jgi:oligoribonuclease
MPAPSAERAPMASVPTSSSPPQPHPDNLVWIDLEMTGLDPDTDAIIEIATLVTDANLHVLAEGPELAIRHPLARLEAMDDWNRRTHQKSGLWQRVLDSRVDASEAEAATIAFLAQWVPAGKSPMCGNSICQDRRFLVRGMPQLERWFHYRNLDVSTLKELARRWSPGVLEGFTKAGVHTALSDIRESVKELAHYRGFMGKLGGQ